MRPHVPAFSRRLLAAVVAIAAVGALVPAAAQAKVLRGVANDPTGDGLSPRVDLVSVTSRFDAVRGTLRVRVTTAQPIDLNKDDQLLITFAGRGCERDLFGVSALTKSLGRPWLYRLRGKTGKPVRGRATVDDVRYTVTFTTKQLRGLKPVYMQAAIYPAASQTPYDQTDCVLLK